MGIHEERLLSAKPKARETRLVGYDETYHSGAIGSRAASIRNHFSCKVLQTTIQLSVKTEDLTTLSLPSTEEKAKIKNKTF